MKVLISVALALFLVGCSSDTKQANEEATDEKKSVAQNLKEVKQAVSTQASGAALYQVCAGCHGADASKAALGKSQIIKGWDAKKIAAALHGYKAGTYGAAMKSLMVGQVSKLSDEDIKILSEYISKL